MSDSSTIIKSLRQNLNVNYIKPDPKKVETFIEELNNTQVALDYLKKDRGFNDETIKYFKLGYCKEKEAIAIPIFKNNECVNIKYRFLNPKKMKYTQETGAEVWLFHEDGLDNAKKKGAVMITEGEFDCMSVWQSGIKSVVSPASGKDSYGIWIELLDIIPKIYICYDNDKPGKKSAREMADRLGVDKCFEVQYPDEIKDANDYFKEYTSEEFRELVKVARPFYKYEFKGLADIIEGLQERTLKFTESKFFPEVKMRKDWMVIVSGRTNCGKTSLVLNVANEFVNRGDPVLVMPFERGNEEVGHRMMNVMFNKSTDDFLKLEKSDWDDIISKCIDKPLYFSVPNKDKVEETIRKAKRFFNVKIVIIDHLDYIVRNVAGNREAEIANTLQSYKAVAQELGIILIIVTHMKKAENSGASVERKPNLDDLKGSSSLQQDPECVILLSETDDGILVDVAKNKGKKVQRTFDFVPETGIFSLQGEITKYDKRMSEEDNALWNSDEF